MYLRAHQSGTHSLLGALTMAGLTAGVVRLFTRRSRYVALLGAATAGADEPRRARSDLRCADCRRRPLFERPVSLPLVAMADPWLIGICVGRFARLWGPGARPLRTAAQLVVLAMSLFLAVKAAMFALAIGRTDTHGQAWTPSKRDGDR